MRSLKEHPVKLQKIVAELDITDATQRHISEVLTQTHFGRNPTWKSISARRENDEIVELARWCRSRSFTVLTWRLDEIAVNWRDFQSKKRAEDFFKSQCKK
jgi:hypothetical protein